MTTALALMPGDLATTEARATAEKTASHMAREYQEATREIGRLMLNIKAQTDRLREALQPDGYSPFDIRFEYNGHREDADTPQRIFEEMKRRAWRVLVDHLGIHPCQDEAIPARFASRRRAARPRRCRGALREATE
jgi:hypothetical protein